MTIVAVWRGLRLPLTRPPPSVSPIRFWNVAGLKLAGLGCLIEIVAGVWNEIVHRVFLTEPKIAPAHSLLVLGMLTVNLGMVIGLTIEYGMITHGFVVASKAQRSLTLLCLVLTFSSIWLAAAGAGIYMAGVFRSPSPNLIIAVFLALVGTLVLVPAKRVLPMIGSELAIGLVFNAVSYIFLVLYVQERLFVPWGLVPLALSDGLVATLKRHVKLATAVMVSSLLVGLLFWATYYPYTMHLFPWSASPGLSVALVFLGGCAGAFLGDRVYARLTSVVLGGISS